MYGFDADSARESQAAWLYQKTVKLPKGLHVIEKNRRLVSQLFAMEMASAADYGLDKFRHKLLENERPNFLKNIEQPYIVLLHGTTWDSKYWPESSWIELIQRLVERGWRCLIPWGNEAEQQRAYRLQTAGGVHAEVLQKMSLTELMKVLLHARAFVSVESGIGHLAAALDIPGVMLHGPTSPHYSGILGKSCEHITSDIACSPCFKRNCPILNRVGVPPCQQAITPQQVLALLCLNDPMSIVSQTANLALH